MFTLVFALGACERPDDPPDPKDGPSDGPVTLTEDTGEPDTGTPPDDTGTEPEGPVFSASLSDTNLITLSWSIPDAVLTDEVYIYDLGLAPAVVGTMDTRVEDGGIHEFTLRIPAQGEPALYLHAEVEVTPPEPPILLAEPAEGPLAAEGNTVLLDMLAPGDVTLSWDESARPPGTFLRLRSPETSPFVDGEEVELQDSLVVPASEFDRIETLSWGLEACTLPAGADTALCSQARPLSLRVVAGLLDGPRRAQVEPTDYTLDWQSAGNAFYVSSPTLGLDEWVNSPSYTVPAELLTPGIHDLSIIPCTFGAESVCTNRRDVPTISGGTVSYPYPLLTFGDQTLLLEGDLVADIDTGAGVETLVAPRTGTLVVMVAEGEVAEPGELVFGVVTGDGLLQQLVVGDGVQWEERHWTTDFSDGQATASWLRRKVGQPLDIAIESSGDVWVNSEFTYRLFHARPDGTSEAPTYPLLRHWDEESATYVPVNPFANPLSGASPSPASAYGERVVVSPDGTVWATLGGVGLHAGGDPPNHSRLMQFDPLAVDLDTTEHDDRFCAYAVPGDGNGVVGLAIDGSRVWYAESTPMYLSVFEPRPEHCEPLLDYDDPAAVAASALQLCEAGQTTADGCVQRVDLGDNIHPAHVEVDPVDGTLWVTDAFGEWLLHYLPATGQVEAIELPDPLMASFFQGFPWQLRVTEDAVYIGEYVDISIVRYDKDSGDVDELAIPFPTIDMNLHSIDLDDEERLWFTLSAEGGALIDAQASTIGYIDLDAWSAGSPAGVLYTGLDEIVDPVHPERAELWAPCFRGIDVAPTGGVIALGSMRRDEAVVLTP